jgi:hypothetical protein
MADTNRDDEFDLEALLHPAHAFEHPMRVVNDPDLTLSEKRAILASWASDTCAVEAVPALRLVPGASRTVDFDDIIDALRALDRTAASTNKPKPHYRKVLEQRKPGIFGRKHPRTDDRGPSLN